MRKRLLSTLLAFCMALTLLPVSALAEQAEPDGMEPVPPTEDAVFDEPEESQAEDEAPEDVPALYELSSGTCGTDLTWVLDEDGTLTVSGTGAMANKYIWSGGNNSVKKVIIEEGVASIGNWAFQSCTGLTDVTIAEGVTSIGEHAFQGCSSLVRVTIPESVTDIGNSAFYECRSLTSVAIPKNVKSIESYVFYGCSGLTSVTIPEGVTSIGDNAFYNCSSLASVTIPESVTSIATGAFALRNSGLRIRCYPGSYAESYASAQAIDYVLLTEVASGTCGTDLNWALDGDGTLTVSGTGAMANSPSWGDKKDSIKKVVIEEGVTSIGNWAFQTCTGLTEVAIAEGVTSIGEYAFYYCSSLTGVTFPEGVTVIGDSAFYGCSSLAGVAIPRSVASIGNRAFQSCTSLANVSIPEGVGSIGDSAFYGCSGLTEVTIPASVVTIGSTAFVNCSKLTSVTILEGVTSIGSQAFYGCTRLTSVTIPASVTSIGSGALGVWASSLRIYCHPGSYAESYAIANKLNYVLLTEAASGACGTGLTWVLSTTGMLTISGEGDMEDQPSWGGMDGSVEKVIIKAGVASIGSSAFAGCGSLTDVIIPKSVTSIGGSAFGPGARICCYAGSYAESYAIANNINYVLLSGFGFCGTDLAWVLYEDGTLVISGLGKMNTSSPLFSPNMRGSIKKIIMEEGVASIGHSAFYDCCYVTSVTIPKSMRYIENDAFEFCESLASVSLPEGLLSIGGGAFDGCTGLTSVTIPGSVTDIGGGVFSRCRSLTNINVASGNPQYVSVGGILFNSDQTTIHTYPAGKADTSYHIPASVTKIEGWAFSCCGNLTSVSLPESITSIGWFAFKDCTSLAHVYFAGTEAQWGTITIGTSNEPLTNAATHFGSSGPEDKAWQYFGFNNSAASFFQDKDPQNYDAGSYFDHFSNVLAQYYRRSSASYYLDYLRIKESESWFGSCYGFAAVEGMVNQNLLPVEAIDSDAADLPSVDLPRENAGVRGLLNYYYLTQYIPAMRSDQYDVRTDDGKQALSKMAAEVTGGTPYMFSYYFSASGHAIILESGRQLADGSYELIGQDNRYHGYTIYEDGKDTGKPVTVTVKISSDCSSCTVFLSKDTLMMKDGRRYRYLEDVNEEVYAFEPVCVFNHFASADPTGTVVSPQLASEAEDSPSVFYYEPNGEKMGSFTLGYQDGGVSIDSGALDSNAHVIDCWYTIGGSTNTVVPGDDGESYFEQQNAPSGLMAVLDAAPNEEYTISNLSGGTFTYAGADGFASVSVSSAKSAIIELTNDSIILVGNKGDFSVSVADANQTVTTVTGEGNSAAAGDIRVLTSSGGITLDAPEGTYKVTFAEADGRETTASVTSNGAGGILVAGPTVEPPKVCGKYASDYTAEISRNGSGFTFTLTSHGDTQVPAAMTAWQAVYDKDNKMVAVNRVPTERLSNGISFSGTVSGEGTCKLFVLDETSAPVIEKYSLN